jgi:hypothetical protein
MWIGPNPWFSGGPIQPGRYQIGEVAKVVSPGPMPTSKTRSQGQGASVQVERLATWSLPHMTRSMRQKGICPIIKTKVVFML